MSKSMIDLEEVDVTEIGLGALLFDMLLEKAKSCKGSSNSYLVGKEHSRLIEQ